MTQRLVILLLALTSARCSMLVSEIGAPPDMTTLNQVEELAGDQSLSARVSLNTGELHVEPGSPAHIYELDLNYNRAVFKPHVEFNRDAGRANLQVELEGEGHSFSSLGNNVVNLRLNPDVPLEFQSDSGVGASHLDFSGMMLRALTLRSGVGETRVSMLQPNRQECGRVEITSGVGDMEVTGLGNFHFTDFRFRGGIGESKLDFSGEWQTLGRIEIEVGIGGVEILLPRDLGAEIRASKGLFSDITLDGFDQRGDLYTSQNLDRVDKVVKLEVRSGIGEVKIRWI